MKRQNPDQQTKPGKEPKPAAPDKKVLAKGRVAQFVSVEGWEYVERTNATGIVVIVAVTRRKRLLLVEQYRKPVGRRVIELPAGLAGDTAAAPDEPLSSAAQRELVEETGFEAAEMEYLSEGPPSAGISNEVVTLFFAKDLKKVGKGGGDESEDIQVHKVPLASAEKWLKKKLKEGLLIDPKVYAGLYFAMQRCDE